MDVFTYPRRLMQITLVCSECGDSYTNDFERQQADRLAHTYCCPRCWSRYHLQQVIPFTVFYESEAVKHASFADDVSGECWQCGRKQVQLHGFTFSDGTAIRLCLVHWKDYQKTAYKLSH